MTETDVVTIAFTVFLSLVTIGYYIVCIIVAVKIMEAKGRTGLIGGLMAVFFGIIGVLLCYCLPGKDGKDVE
jgi:hypothetical protein